MRNFCDQTDLGEHGPAPFVANVGQAAAQNPYFRTAFWTGKYLQMTLMCISPQGEVGLEQHLDTDQVIRVESGLALVHMGATPEEPDSSCRVGAGGAIFVPAGTWHNILNISNAPLKLSSIYAPPHHAPGTIHRTHQEAEEAEAY